ncbi:MAG: hypothetical protein WDM91_20950 [Rhizomicrobium sp.]
MDGSQKVRGMTYDAITKHLLSGATLSVQWGDDPIFRIGGKMWMRDG